MEKDIILNTMVDNSGECIELNSFHFKFITLSLLTNFYSDKLNKKELFNLHLNVDKDYNTVFILFNSQEPSGRRIIMSFSFALFSKYLKSIGLSNPNVEELSKCLIGYLNDLMKDQLDKDVQDIDYSSSILNVFFNGLENLNSSIFHYCKGQGSFESLLGRIRFVKKHLNLIKNDSELNGFGPYLVLIDLINICVYKLESLIDSNPSDFKEDDLDMVKELKGDLFRFNVNLKSLK